MEETKNEEAVTYVNSEAGFGSPRIVQGVDCLIYISDTDMEERRQQPTIKNTTYIKIDLRIHIQLLDPEVKP